MNAQIQQIVASYEQALLTPEQIQESMFPDFTLEYIEQILLQFSPKRKQLVKDLMNPSKQQTTLAESDITEGEFQQIRNRLVNLALHSDNEEIAARVGKFLFNEKKGRNDVKKKESVSNTFNIAIFNRELSEARKAIEQTKKESLQEGSIMIDSQLQPA